jgi:hypothetical protein
MKSDVIAVSSREDKVELVLKHTERVAAYKDLSHKGALHLRLLAEEMMSMVRAIAGNVSGKFWIENEGDEYALHLRVETDADYSAREKLISVSTTGENEAHRGFMGKIRAFFEPFETAPAYFDPELDATGSNMVWSMRSYQEQLRQYVSENRAGAAEAWDELEKSVISHVADDIKVSIRGRTVEMTVTKKIA